MKQIFYIIALLLAFSFSDFGSNLAFGQNMAQEHYVPWTEADKTGKYYMERCEKCNNWITGYSEDELKNNMKKHMYAKHPNLSPDDNKGATDPDDNSGTGGSSGSSHDSSSENNYSAKASLVHVNDVAYALQKIGVCGYKQFICDCEMYGLSNNGGSVKASEMVGFIKWHYATRSDISLDNAINNYQKFIMFTRPYSGEYYDVYTNRNYICVGSYICDYYIVFNNNYHQ